MEPLIELTDLARSYGGRPAVRGISLAIPGGERPEGGDGSLWFLPARPR